MKEKVIAEMMGKKVCVTETYYRDGSTTADKKFRVDWFKQQHPARIGWIVGVVRLQCGISVPATGMSEFYEQGYLRQDGTITALKVSFWPTMNPVFIPINNVQFAPEGIPVSPSRWAWEHTDEGARNAYRESMRKEMIEVARDERGRWFGWGTKHE